ncbi:uncharacterized protein LOC129919292 [Episyrphus balteatus]|uniref:uncharacterized protein LOC129919292 n=1 Tax=Episyrphus balteatus TaxID=286459 RepID=UPI00248589CA|nr:uncharacterized protein LOC129919292 [Episyrphus balteatus]
MDDVNIKSEFTAEMEDERYLNYDELNTATNNERNNAEVMENMKYDLTIENELMENENYHEMEGDNNDDRANMHDFQQSADNQMQDTNMSFDSANGSLASSSNVMDGGNVRFEFTAGYRRNSVLIYLIDEKQLFTKKYAHNHMDRYTCYTKSCKASLLFDTYLNKIVKLYHTFHLHPDQSDVYKKMKVLNEMKDYCLTNDGVNLTTKQIFDQKCNVMKEAAHLVEYNKIKRNLNRLKKTAMQKPTTTTAASNYDNQNVMYGMFPNDVVNATNEYASKWDTSTRKPSLRVPSPVSSESESIVAASNSSHVEPAASSTPGPSNQFVEVETPAFKKIKLTREVPYTEGYLEESTPFVPKSSQLRKSSPPPPAPAPKQRANPPQKPRPPPNPRVHQEEGQQQQHICSTCPCIAAQENEYDKIGKAWASELKLMTLDQQIFAKRAIAEIIFEGQLGGLSRNSVLQRRGGDGDPFVEEAEYIFEKTEPTSVI